MDEFAAYAFIGTAFGVGIVIGIMLTCFLLNHHDDRHDR